MCRNDTAFEGLCGQVLSFQKVAEREKGVLDAVVLSDECREH
jgi:hypothetical protein